jgi:porphobilinogen synthase
MKKLRAKRSSQSVRDRNAETKLCVKDLVNPYFIADGKNIKDKIKGFYGVCRFSPDTLLEDIKTLRASGVDKVLLFGAPDSAEKDETGSGAYADEGIVQRSVAAIKKAFPQLTVITDVCLCAYTKSGHCGIVSGNRVLNDETLPYLARIAVSHAKAGADIVAPSAMMDGQVGAIRRALDASGFAKVGILAYSAKYASSLYGPFREAEKSAPSFGDRKTYQMDYRNLKEALSEVKEDIREGADMVMVKPAHAYLDVIRAVKTAYPKAPLAAYHVSGEYAMLKAAARAGVFEEKAAMMEVLTSIKRAGADMIITYFAKQAADSIRSGK